jgi:hypothetical protein
MHYSLKKEPVQDITLVNNMLQQQLTLFAVLMYWLAWLGLEGFSVGV